MLRENTKKILYVHHDMGCSGASRSLSFLLDKLDEKKYSAKVHCIFGGPVTELFKERKVEVSDHRGVYPFHGSTVTGMSLKLFLTNLIRFPQSLIAAYQLIKSVKPDLVHLNSSCLFVVAMATKLYNKNIKTVCHVREPLLRRSVSAFIMRYMNYLFVDQFIAIDQFTGRSMKSRNNLQIIFNSVNFEEYHNRLDKDLLRKKLGLEREDTIFLYLARISKSNGAMELVQVANRLAKAFPRFKFVLAGFNNSSKDQYAAKVMKAAGANSNIHLLPFQNSVPSLIAGADVMVVPFTQPHFARSVVEASAIGVPSIGANVGGVNELIMDGVTGFLYDSEQEFYDCCIRLGENKFLRRKMGAAAIRFAEVNFDNNRTSKRVFQIYNNLLEPQEEASLL